MEILRGGRVPELVDGWAAALAGHMPPAPHSAIEAAFLALTDADTNAEEPVR